MTVYFNGHHEPEEPKQSLSQKIGLDGHVLFLKKTIGIITVEDNPADMIFVRRASTA